MPNDPGVTSDTKNKVGSGTFLKVCNFISIQLNAMLHRPQCLFTAGLRVKYCQMAGANYEIPGVYERAGFTVGTLIRIFYS